MEGRRMTRVKKDVMHGGMSSGEDTKYAGTEKGFHVGEINGTWR
jgi:hypothetical protein